MMRTKSEAPPAYAGGFLLSTCGIACETRRSMLPIIECIHPLPHGRGFFRSRLIYFIELLCGISRLRAIFILNMPRSAPPPPWSDHLAGKRTRERELGSFSFAPCGSPEDHHNKLHYRCNDGLLQNPEKYRYCRNLIYGRKKLTEE